MPHGAAERVAEVSDFNHDEVIEWSKCGAALFAYVSRVLSHFTSGCVPKPLTQACEALLPGLYEHYNDTQNVYIINDVCAGGELHDLIKEHAEAQRPLPGSGLPGSSSRTAPVTSKDIGYRLARKSSF